MGTAALRIEPLDACFGASVTGLSLASLDEATFAELHAAWLEYALLIFPGQGLERAQQDAFARRFGALEFTAAPLSNVRADGSLRPDDGSDDVVKILRGNMGWHCDSTYMPVQAKGAVFTAQVVPSAGGETGFADMRAAFDALDESMKARLEGLSAYHSLAWSQAKVGHAQKAGSSYSGYGFGQDPQLRPLVKVHPETGRRSLLIGRHAHAVTGLSASESEELLDGLLEFACQAPRVVHHHWSPGDALLWDNRCLLHRATPWDMSEPRVMHHTRIAGDPASESAQTTIEAPA
ncbi:MAG TPA: TauD/TfdA family dioxygenase [Pseudomonadales bacterium]|nr:TauD/TfdA family dioxygenase [Pseudomonadales bacterium]